MQIYKFRPAPFKICKFEIEKIENFLGKKLYLSSKGRWAILEILQSFPQVKNLLLPVYICDSILGPIKDYGYNLSFYDLDPLDLNASLKSILAILESKKIDAVLVASMYGNPADLVYIEQFCKYKKIILIDDGAQSFGATLNGRPIGAFGDAGFVAFSPGKPAAAHAGALFWTSGKLEQSKKSYYFFYELFILFDFYLNRYLIKITKPLKLFSILSIIKREIIDRIYSNKVRLLRLSFFSKYVIGGVTSSLLSNEFNFRNEFLNEICISTDQQDIFRVVNQQRGIPSIHKIVLIFRNKNHISSFKDFLHRKKVYFNEGYKLLENDVNKFPIATELQGKIIELPIDPSYLEREYMKKCILEFISFYS